MDHILVVQQLKKQFPNKKLILNKKDEPTEIICETEPTDAHPSWSEAIAVIDSSIPHIHRKTAEQYHVLKGELIVWLNGEKTTLKQGESITIQPDVNHFARGNETWVRVTARPGWTLEDHILV